jgi:hypothetical protein
MSKMSSNVSKYQEIYKKKQQDPNLSLAKLCDEAGTTYQSYNNWVKKHHRTSEVSGQSLRITVQVSIEELARLVMGGGRNLPVRIDSILQGLPPQERKQLAQHLGMIRLERVQSGKEQGSSDGTKDMDSEEAQA